MTLYYNRSYIICSLLTSALFFCPNNCVCFMPSILCMELYFIFPMNIQKLNILCLYFVLNILLRQMPCNNPYCYPTSYYVHFMPSFVMCKLKFYLLQFKLMYKTNL